MIYHVLTSRNNYKRFLFLKTSEGSNQSQALKEPTHDTSIRKQAQISIRLGCLDRQLSQLHLNVVQYRKCPKYWWAKNLAILSENHATKILANLNLAVWPWPWLYTYVSYVIRCTSSARVHTPHMGTMHVV